jgi:hypothetical protein
MILLKTLFVFLPSRARLRLAAYFGLVFLGLSALSARALYASGREAALALGGELAELSDLLEQRESLMLNGSRFRHAVTHSDESPERVLDRIQAHCDTRGGLLREVLGDLESLDRTAFAKVAPPGALRAAVIRQDGKGRGVVICFTDSDQHTLTDVAPALSLLMRVTDPRELGELLYSYAEQSPNGRTRVVTLWTRGGLDLAAMFPEHGDASGNDSRVVPRPPRARRILSASAEGQPFGVRTYESPLSTSAVHSFYVEWARKQGFSPVAADADAGATAYLRADGVQVFVSLHELDGQTLVTLTEAGGARQAGASVVVRSESRAEVNDDPAN